MVSFAPPVLLAKLLLCLSLLSHLLAGLDETSALALLLLARV
jgi:hypothetical protein